MEMGKRWQLEGGERREAEGVMHMMERWGPGELLRNARLGV